jgi:hypothetical protein
MVCPFTSEVVSTVMSFSKDWLTDWLINFCWPSPAQRLLVPSPKGLMTIFYYLTTSESRLLYDWRFTANQFFLAPSPLSITTRDTEICGHNPYVTSSLTRRWVCLLWICLSYVKCTYRTYSVLLKILPFCSICKSSDSQGFAKQIMPSLLILRYNGSLLTLTVTAIKIIYANQFVSHRKHITSRLQSPTR